MSTGKAHQSTSKPSGSSLAMVRAPSTSWSVAMGMVRKEWRFPALNSIWKSVGRLATCSSSLTLQCRQRGCSSSLEQDQAAPRMTGVFSTSQEPLPYAASRMCVVQWSVKPMMLQGEGVGRGTTPIRTFRDDGMLTTNDTRPVPFQPPRQGHPWVTYSIALTPHPWQKGVTARSPTVVDGQMLTQQLGCLIQGDHGRAVHASQLLQHQLDLRRQG